MNAARTLRIALLNLTAMVLLTGIASAQPAWNRHVEAISIVPDDTATGVADVTVILTAWGEGSSSVPLDLTTEIELSVNGTVQAVEVIPVGVDPGNGGCVDGAGCGGSCGTGAANGQAASLICRATGSCDPICDCACGFPNIAYPIPGVGMSPGDEIMVLLRPAPGALPDSDTSDDQLIVIYDQPIFWDPRIENAEIDFVEVAGGGYQANVEVSGTFFHSGLLSLGPGGSQDLSVQVQVVKDGVPVEQVSLNFAPVPLSGACSCGNVCGSYNGLDHTCIPYYAGGCNCGWPWLAQIPDCPVDPGDELTILLRPAPDALPTLPGFEDDDELPLQAPSTGVTAHDRTPAGVWLEPGQPNPFTGSTQIAFTLDRSADVSMEVFDLQGRRVKTLVSGRTVDAGRTMVGWDGRTDAGDRAPAGIYFGRLLADGEVRTMKLTRTD